MGHDGILLLINEEFLPVSFFERWFDRAIPLADFTIERGGKPLRRVQVHRLVHQRVAFPFAFSPERTAARERLRTGSHPWMSREEPRRHLASRSPHALSPWKTVAERSWIRVL